MKSRKIFGKIFLLFIADSRNLSLTLEKAYYKMRLYNFHEEDMKWILQA